MAEATQGPAAEGPNEAQINNGMTPAPPESEHQDASESNASKSTAPLGASASGAPREPAATGSGKKRKKVKQACEYCRRSHMVCEPNRPCNRCIERNIGHLCHDAPRQVSKKKKDDHDNAAATDDDDSARRDPTQSEAPLNPLQRLNLVQPQLSPSGIGNAAPVVQPSPVSATQVPGLNGSGNSIIGYNDWNMGSHGHFQDIHPFDSPYMFHTSEVNNEFHMLNNFLTNSLKDDAGMDGHENNLNGLLVDPSLTHTMGKFSSAGGNAYPAVQQPGQSVPSQAAVGNSISRPSSSFPGDKAREVREQYYLAAADPKGNESPEDRLNQLLRDKYEAGLLRPFNYVNGYARLNKYMETHLQPQSRQKILRQIDGFRPKFRERIQKLSDLELIHVEMWFERTLMEYDRVFASMAIPACCWRRTGEIFRGNREMAELIHVPMEKLRDGKIAIHEIIAERSLVSYWEKFGTIAFDKSRKAMLTSCSLKNPDESAKDPEIQCCFSFTVRRDAHDIPALIVGNFLPILS
ncbi:hypothetical protein BDY21DRAFT_334713 [Lineolata rhizophorae]|uniref:Zn(2)-C6 fungal-type domain-containing protein n=1 Tax=Lineolata rhizophorae TaxID=578093 RepID=A0A6A6P8V5_9PEZI|nr:hypothetical protein BDY21DRAFT_334713 [Lineolata rhizophorae]